MDNGWLIFFIMVGAWLTIFGARIMFSDKYLNRMYERGYWKKDSALFDEKSGRRYDKYRRGGGIFALGLIWLISALVAWMI